MSSYSGHLSEFKGFQSRTIHACRLIPVLWKLSPVSPAYQYAVLY